jgi:RNA polymerase sigma-70 factor (ECF subfamily)
MRAWCFPDVEEKAMSSLSAMQTSASLLGRLRNDPADQAAWSEFVRRYAPEIYNWCHRWKLQDADAQDVTQAVLVKLAEKMRSFTYDPARSFRAYGKTLSHYAWCDFLESRRRPDLSSGDTEVLQRLESVEMRDDLMTRLNAVFDLELLEEAKARVQQRVESHTWDAFSLTALEGLSGAAVAEQLRLKVTTVFKAKSKVLKMLHEELARLERPYTESP